MSTKKDKFSAKEKKYMKLALKLASSRIGLTGNNPSVGCLIVKNDKIISIGLTGLNGRPHAEVNAINNSFERLKGSKMYVTLEPCNHYGKTPPCTKKILKSGISHVYYAIKDIDKKVKGKSKNILSKNKVKVSEGLLNKEANELYESYFINRIKKLPFVTGKIAISKNKLIYSQNNSKITNDYSDKITHYLRYKNDSILISSKTLNNDNPKLNCRLNGYEKFSPKRIILDKNLESNLKSYVIKTSNKKNTIIFHNSHNYEKEKILRKKGIKLIRLNLGTNELFNLKTVLKKLFIFGVRHILIEGGDKLTKNFIKYKLLNKFYLFKSPKKISIKGKFVRFTSLDILVKQYTATSKIYSKLVKDSITVYKRR